VILENFELSDETKRELQRQEYNESLNLLPARANVKNIFGKVLTVLRMKKSNRILPVDSSTMEDTEEDEEQSQERDLEEQESINGENEAIGSSSSNSDTSSQSDTDSSTSSSNSNTSSSSEANSEDRNTNSDASSARTTETTSNPTESPRDDITNRDTEQLVKQEPIRLPEPDGIQPTEEEGSISPEEDKDELAEPVPQKRNKKSASCITICRSAVGFMIDNFIFEGFVALVAIVSMLVLCLEPAAEAKYSDYQIKLANGKTIAATTIEWILLVIMFIEFILRCLHKGFIGYLKSFLRCIDLFVMLFTLGIAIQNVATDGRYTTFLRTVRILKIFRIISYVQIMRSVKVTKKSQKIQSTIRTIVVDFLIIFIFILFIAFLFGVLGMELFKGKFGRCNDSSINSRGDCIGLFLQTSDVNEDFVYGITVHRKWQNPPFNFDNMANTVLTLIQVASLDGWSETLYNAMDITHVNQQPVRDNSPWNALFFIVFVIVGSFYVMNLIVGVIIQRIYEHRGIALLTIDQRNWMLVKSEIIVTQPTPLLQAPTNRFKAVIFHFIRSKTFRWFILFILVLNIGLIVSHHHGEPKYWTETLQFSNYVFVVIFFMEAVLKIVGYGPRKYFLGGFWDLYDFIVLAGSIIAIIMEVVCVITKTKNTNALWVAVFGGRICRILRVPRLISKFKSARFLFDSLVTGMSNILKILLIVVCIMLVYASLGIALFGNIRFQNSYNSSANFRNYSNAMIVLIRMLTMDDWTLILLDCLSAAPPLCTKTGEFSDCGPGTIITALYFLSFFMIGSYIILNLVIASVMDNFLHIFTKGKSFALRSHHIAHFTKCWQKYDQHAVGAIKPTDLKHLVQQLYDEGNTMLGFGVKQNPLLFKVLYYQISKGIEGARDESRHIVHKDTFDFLSTANDTKMNEQLGKVMRFHDVLLLLAKYGLSQEVFTLEEKNMRRDSIQEALQQTSAQTIQKFMRNVVWLRKTLISLKKNDGFFKTSTDDDSEQDQLNKHTNLEKDLFMQDIDHKLPADDDDEQSEEK
jgi:hypothetical protein